VWNGRGTWVACMRSGVGGGGMSSPCTIQFR
jgi:hypothetical protein